MRPFVLLTVLVTCVVTASTAAAQDDVPSPCPAWAYRGPADITLDDGRRLRAAIQCLGADAVAVDRDGAVTRLPLSAIRRITTPADPLWDGAVKGAAIPLVLFLIVCHDCHWGGYMTRSVAAYAALGVAFDAMNTNRRTLYDRALHGPTLTATVRF